MASPDLASDRISSEAIVQAFAGTPDITPQHARELVVNLGQAAVPALLDVLKSARAPIRWEAAKALAEIGSSGSVHGLIDALTDEDGSVRWIAAEGLAHVGYPALVPLLTALVTRTDDGWLRDGAHHVLRWTARGELAPILAPVLRALETWEPSLNTPGAAGRALKLLHEMPAPARIERSPGVLRFPVHAVSRIHQHSSRSPWQHLVIREFAEPG